MFKLCGENVKFFNDCWCVVWNFIEFDGVIFSNRLMDYFEYVMFDVIGSGEVVIGVIESDFVV